MNEGFPLNAGVIPTFNLGNSNDSNGFGGDGSWAWVWIILIFAIFGFGNGGFGGFGGNSGSAVQGALTREQACIDNNFQNLMRETASISDSVNLGFANLNSTICNQQYDSANMINGVNTNIMQGNFALQTALNGLGTQMQQCCCNLEQGLSNINFNNAQNTCAITNAIATSTRDVIDNQNQNYRALHDEIVANRMADKEETIRMQQSEISKLQLAASQSAQNSYLINQLRPTAIPAYLTCNPFTGQVYGGYNGCGCGCNC